MFSNPCQECGGAGFFRYSQTCSSCSGSGCGDCSNTGREITEITEITCEDCGGSGYAWFKSFFISLFIFNPPPLKWRALLLKNDSRRY